MNYVVKTRLARDDARVYNKNDSRTVCPTAIALAKCGRWRPNMAISCPVVLAVIFYRMEAPVQGNDYELTSTHKDIYAGYTRFVKYATGSVIAIVVLMALFLL
ncbi:hypothetical protein CSC3H3_06225 [Thalassospira marina]|uniref:Cytochrome c oxidase subunit IV bacterial aa3 type domain-containing protein n=1 Tax=Thalassospira marina TaxID=2048283 RepID=A0ABM6Q898_9PROT|nr:hypothetical protein CSC3H3_06225 [Thalassospira marina]